MAFCRSLVVEEQPLAEVTTEVLLRGAEKRAHGLWRAASRDQVLSAAYRQSPGAGSRPAVVPTPPLAFAPSNASPSRRSPHCSTTTNAATSRCRCCRAPHPRSPEAGWSPDDPLTPIALSHLAHQAGFTQFRHRWIPHLRNRIQATPQVVGAEKVLRSPLHPHRASRRREHAALDGSVTPAPSPRPDQHPPHRRDHRHRRGTAELLGDSHPGEELSGGMAAHLRAVVRDC